MLLYKGFKTTVIITEVYTVIITVYIAALILAVIY